MSKFKNSWELLKRSFQVVGANKKLLLFPAITLLCTVFIALFFIVPIFLGNTGHAYSDFAHWQAVFNRWLVVDTQTEEVYVTPVAYVLILLIYLASMFLATFFNVAFYNEILNALNGRPVSLAGGFRMAFSRIKAIAAWSLMSGLVGILIRTIEERLDFVGRWIMGLIGFAWSVASIFVIPIIVREEQKTSPLQFLKTSAGALKKTWGEGLVGYVGLRLSALLIFVFTLLFLCGGFALAVLIKNYWFMAAVGAAWLVGIFIFLYIFHVAEHVFRGALYLYAVEGVIPGPFDSEQLNTAWKIKAGRKAKN